MPLIKADRVKETTTSPGTGAFTLNGAVAGYRAFSSVMADGDHCFYTAIQPSTNQWECGWAKFIYPNTLERWGLTSASSYEYINFTGNVEVFMSLTATQTNCGAYPDGYTSISNVYLTPTPPTLKVLGEFGRTFVDNVIIGNQAMAYALDTAGAIRNIAIGYQALRYIGSADTPTVSGSSVNIAIGYGAGANLREGSGNTLIGSVAGADLVQGSNNLVINCTGSQTRLGANSSNVIAIGSTVPIPSDYTINVGNSLVHTDCYIAGHLHPSGAVRPASIADASAPTNAIYYSTTAGKLVYKDSGGTVNNLY